MSNSMIGSFNVGHSSKKYSLLQDRQETSHKHMSNSMSGSFHFGIRKINEFSEKARRGGGGHF